MDGHRFDHLARAVVGASSRRAVVRLLAGGALGGLLSAGDRRAVAAACRLAGQRCNETHRCCAGARCAANGRCTCKVGQNFFACDGPGTRCVNIATSEKHCGGCGNPPCGEGEICRTGGCVAMCEDGLHDGQETDVDCGGPECPPCAKGKLCEVDEDCEIDLFCDADGTCQDPHSCSDGVKNGQETDIDCGGPNCRRCPDGEACFINNDCESNFCNRSAGPTVAGVCRIKASCRNGRKDGGETDVDCGGPECPPCEFGQKCDSADDCAGPNFLCLDRAGDGTAHKVCVECKTGDHCLALYGGTRPYCVRNKCRQCRDEVDCGEGEECDDGTCIASGTCTAGKDFCHDGVEGCNGTSACSCFQTISGEPFCSSSFGQCFACEADSDCDLVTGAGSACIVHAGPVCGDGCLPTNNRACLGPCVIP